MKDVSADVKCQNEVGCAYRMLKENWLCLRKHANSYEMDVRIPLYICTHAYQLYFPPFLTAFLFSFLAHPCFCIPYFSSSFFCPAFLQVTTSCHPLYPLSFLQIGCLKFYNNFLSISVLLLPAFLSSAFLLSACWLSCIICLLSFTLLSLPACFPSFC
jgi:hypothetical protein